jgi:transcription antitermination factor NusG
VGDRAKLYPGCGMDVCSVALSSDQRNGSLSGSSPEERWYAIYTRANHEKRLAAELNARAIENFLPLYGSVRRWRDRRVHLDMPLFAGYVFVRFAIEHRLRILQLPSVVRIVAFGGYPTALPDDEIQTLRSGLSDQCRAEPYPFLTVGRRVRLKSGPLTGLEGILLRRKSGYRVVISIELIQRSIIADTDIADVETVPAILGRHDSHSARVGSEL